jgi:hypothetical protein
MPNAVPLVLIDWNGDGSFGSTGEKVSPRLRGNPGVKLSRGRDQVRALAPPMAGAQSFTLDNQSRDYSIENSSGTLYGDLLPGRKAQVWVAAPESTTVVKADAFARANSTTMGALESGITTASWSTGTGATWGITSSQAYCISSGNGHQVTASGLPLPDGIIECVMSGDFSGASAYRSPCLVFRWSDDENYLLVRLVQGTTGVRLSKTAAGVLSDLKTYTTTLSSGQAYSVRVHLNGARIEVFLDGASVIIHTLSTADQTAYLPNGTLGFMLLAVGAEGVGARWDTLSHTATPLATGRLDGITQHPEQGVRSAEITALGMLSRLRGLKVSTALYQSITTDAALGYLLDAAGWTSTADRVFDTGKTTLQYWWLDNEDAFEAARALLVTEGPGAALYEDGLGRIVFESRHYRLLTARSQASQATISDAGSEPLHSPPLRYDPGLQSVVNECVIETKQRTPGSSQTIWTLGSTITLAEGETRTFQIRTTSGDPFSSAVVSTYTCSSGTLGVALDRDSGAVATLSIYPPPASGPRTVTSVTVTGVPVPVSGATRIVNTVNTTTSQGRYGLRSFPLQTRPEINVNDAQDFANAVVSWYQEPRATALVALNNGSSARLAQQLAREISDRITVVDAQTGLNTEMMVERIEQEISGNGQIMRTVLGCEKVVDTNQYFVLGTSSLDGTAVLGY